MFMPSLCQGKSLRTGPPFSPCFHSLQNPALPNPLPAGLPFLSAAVRSRAQSNQLRLHTPPLQSKPPRMHWMKSAGYQLSAKTNLSQSEPTKATSLALPSVLLHRKGRKVKVSYSVDQELQKGSTPEAAIHCYSTVVALFKKKHTKAPPTRTPPSFYICIYFQDFTCMLLLVNRVKTSSYPTCSTMLARKKT